MGIMSQSKENREPRGAVTLDSNEIRRCSICGTKLPADDPNALCPLCLIRNVLDQGRIVVTVTNEEVLADSGSSSVEKTAARFGHYEILKRPDGTLHELGHGAMGITFKAIDVNLRVPVTLKLLNLRFLKEPSARHRFFREARSAASVRHPNVATVYHLGSRGREIYYAMEFVEGETLENLIKRFGRLDVKLALDVVKRVAEGLTAVHKQKLVHRDIKPSNIMVSAEGDAIASVKIIDLGLAKMVDELNPETESSIPGTFVGTPEFASPEQIAGVGVDIRSDLYSLGVTLWRMLGCSGPFKGNPAAVMHQQQHAPLPTEELKGVPQPAIAFLEVLLEKDPARRFQSPADLLKVVPMITAAIEERRDIDRESLRCLRDDRPVVDRKPPKNLAAYELYQRGIALIDLLNRDANQKGIQFLRKAIKMDQNFALAHAGLARAYIEQQGLGGEKSLLDTAVELCRVAIALDPKEVRGYQQLARAYFMKGWYPQCDEALQKALQLGPDDDRTNALAAHRALAAHQFGESYKFFRKACTLNPNQTQWLYLAAELLFRVDLSDVAEKWMRQALARESNPLYHHLMECYLMLWRRKFAAARLGFARLPRELKSYEYSPSDGLLFCAIGLSDWAALIECCNAFLQKNPDLIWPGAYLAIALDRSGRLAEARELTEEVAERGLDRLERPAQPEVPWDVPLYVAWGYRYLDRKDEAYHYLDQYLAHRTILHIPLGLQNPLLDVFKNDPEFKKILAEMSQKFEIARKSIREHEAAAPQS